MTKIFAAFAAIALIGLLLPTPASADIFTFVCDPATESAPADWFGGSWPAQVRLVVDTGNRSIELFDKDAKSLAGTGRPGRLSGLNNYKLDVIITDNLISWGIVEMWGFSGYVNRSTGRLDVIWTNPSGYNVETSTRQFHGTCRAR